MALTPGEVYVNGRKPIDERFDVATLSLPELEGTVARLSELQKGQSDHDLATLFLELATRLRAQDLSTLISD